MNNVSLEDIKAKPVIIESQAWGSLAYFYILNNAKTVIIDGFEHYVKASYRNRYDVCGPNGKQILSLHLKNGRNQRQPSNKVSLFYEENWQYQHWQSLCSNYRSSPYFEYYEDDFVSFYDKSENNLQAFNLKTIEFIKQQLELTFEVELSQKYISTNNENYIDLRSVIKPNKTLPNFLIPVVEKTYHQVFDDRNPFYQNLSILDALFNLGPRAKGLL